MQQTLDNMTAAQWRGLTEAQRESLRDYSGLTKQLRGLEGCRVEVVTDYGETRRFWVGRSTGWRPCHLEVKTRRSLGGMAAERAYQTVRIVTKGPRR